MSLTSPRALLLATLASCAAACSSSGGTSGADSGPSPESGADGATAGGSDATTEGGTGTDGGSPAETGALADGPAGETGAFDSGEGGSPDASPDAGPTTGWAWVNGSNAISSVGSYGTVGDAGTPNEPPAREAAAWATGPGGKLWLFGGYSYVGNSSDSYFNDLWSFDTASGEWTWVAGSNMQNVVGNYPATVGNGGAGYFPGERAYASLWVDGSGTVWLFGGCNSGNGCSHSMNDLWKLSGATWTWVAGSSAADAPSTYPASVGMVGAPGARNGAASWIDAAGHLWLFGGYAGGHYLADLWKFDGSAWTWAGGSSSIDTAGTYGMKGAAAGGNLPGGRDLPTVGVDKNGAVWMMAGYGVDSTGHKGYLNDLWRFDGTDWTWVAGSTTGSNPSASAVAGAYPSTPGKTGAGYVPGGREAACGWLDSSGNFWMFGGWGYDSAQSQSYLNDLWKFDGTNWTWISGSNLVNAVGAYGAPGAKAPTNTPGARWNPLGWYAAGKLWMFGGSGYDTMATPGVMNDLWTYQP